MGGSDPRFPADPFGDKRFDAVQLPAGFAEHPTGLNLFAAGPLAGLSPGAFGLEFGPFAGVAGAAGLLGPFGAAGLGGAFASNAYLRFDNGSWPDDFTREGKCLKCGRVMKSVQGTGSHRRACPGRNMPPKRK